MWCMIGHMLHQGHDPQEHQHDTGRELHGAGEPSPRQVLRARYARGEITEEQLLHMLAVLDETEEPGGRVRGRAEVGGRGPERQDPPGGGR